ncbi:hypothetical protein TNCV_3364551 [Trichonephila clavipes]|nr:hypothetical protein TNCV_3364551 [Trichonephila clavipes]
MRQWQPKVVAAGRRKFQIYGKRIEHLKENDLRKIVIYQAGMVFLKEVSMFGLYMYIQFWVALLRKHAVFTDILKYMILCICSMSFLEG